MQDVSARWDAAARQSGDVVSRVEVWRNGAPVRDSKGATVTLSVVDGTVRMDESSNNRRTASLTVADSDLLPKSAEDTAAVLNATDTDLKVFTGFRYIEGDTELVPAGVYRLASPARPSLLSNAVTLDARDYASVLQAARFVKPWNVPAGGGVVSHVSSMVRDVLPWVEVLDLSGTKRTTGAVAFEKDRWAAITDLLKGAGLDGAFDAAGRFVIRPMPAIKSTPDWVVDYGTSSSVLMDAGVSFNSDRVYNAVVATSSQQDVVASFTVYQTSGPFAWRSGFKRPRFFSSPMLRSTADCRNAAAAILSRSLAVSEDITPTCAPNPALDVGDTVAVQLPVQGLVSRVLSGASLPLRAGSMSLTVRTVAEASDVPGE